MRRKGPRHVLGWLILTCLFTTSMESAVGKDLYRILYSDDPLLSSRMGRGRNEVRQGRRARAKQFSAPDERRFGQERDPFIEAAFASYYWVLPLTGQPPKKPKRVDGFLIYTDTEYDQKWLLTEKPDQNPSLQVEKVVSGLKEKWAEYQFLLKYAPELAPPLTKLGSEVLGSVLTPEERKLRQPDAFEKLSAAKKEALIASIDKKLAEVTPEQMNLAAKALEESLGGRSIVKLRAGFHSEGNVPKTYKAWAPIWKGYLAETRPKIQTLLQEKKLPPMGVSETQLELQNVIWNFDYIEGTVLEELLLDPSQVVVQKMIKIGKEVRIHVVEGKILKGATFLRNYEPFGQYLTLAEAEKFESEFETKFIANLDKKYLPWASSSDLVYDTETKSYRILDLNPGYESGYLFPEEDLYTTHLFSKYFTGEDSPYLLAFEDLHRKALGEEKAALLKKMYRDYHPLVYGDPTGGYDHESFWDRVIRSYIDHDLKENATAEAVDTSLRHFEDAGLVAPTIYFQFLNEVQKVKKIKLESLRVKHWVKKLSALCRQQGLPCTALDEKGDVRLIPIKDGRKEE